MSELQIHPVAALFPLMEAKDFLDYTNAIIKRIWK